MAKIIFRGHESQRQQLEELFNGERLPQSNILVGPSGVGKKTLLLFEIARFFCQSPNKPCGECGSCLRASQRESEFHRIIEPDESGSIKVDDIRQIKKITSFQTISKKFFVIIDDADKMTLQSSNALLKVLEEPPKDCHFFLITAQPNALPATIRSRAQGIRFQGLNELEMSEQSGVSPWAARLSRAQIDLAKQLDALHSLKLTISDWLDLMFEGSSKSLSLDLDKTQYDSFIFYLKTLVRDALVYQAGLKHKILNLEDEKIIQKLAPIESHKLHKLYEQLEIYQKRIVENVDKNLVWDNLIYSLRDVQNV